MKEKKKQVNASTQYKGAVSKSVLFKQKSESAT